jgi:hypothetical protein
MHGVLTMMLAGSLTLADDSIQVAALWPPCTPRALVPAGLYVSPGASLTLSNVTLVLPRCSDVSSYYEAMTACGMARSMQLERLPAGTLGAMLVLTDTRIVNVSGTAAATPNLTSEAAQARLVLHRVLYTCGIGQVQRAPPGAHYAARTVGELRAALDTAGSVGLNTTISVPGSAVLKLSALASADVGSSWWPAAGVQLGLPVAPPANRTLNTAAKGGGIRVVVQGSPISRNNSNSNGGEDNSTAAGPVIDLGMRPAVTSVGPAAALQ